MNITSTHYTRAQSTASAVTFQGKNNWRKNLEDKLVLLAAPPTDEPDSTKEWSEETLVRQLDQAAAQKQKQINKNMILGGLGALASVVWLAEMVLFLKPLAIVLPFYFFYKAFSTAQQPPSSTSQDCEAALKYRLKDPTKVEPIARLLKDLRTYEPSPELIQAVENRLIDVASDNALTGAQALEKELNQQTEKQPEQTALPVSESPETQTTKHRPLAKKGWNRLQ